MPPKGENFSCREVPTSWVKMQYMSLHMKRFYLWKWLETIWELKVSPRDTGVKMRSELLSCEFLESVDEKVVIYSMYIHTCYTYRALDLNPDFLFVVSETFEKHYLR